MIDAGEDLQQQQRRRPTRKYFQIRRWLAVSGRKRRQHRVHRRIVGIVQEELIDEQHGAEGEEGEAEADPGPTEGVGGRRVADQRLIGPVLGPGPRHARPPRHRGERGEHQEIRRLRARAAGSGCRPASSRSTDRRRAATWRDHRAH